jgi:DNA-binding NarL/FixJ family response regulator
VEHTARAADAMARRVLVVEDATFVAGILTSALAARGFDARPAGDALGAKKLLVSFDPDIALLDIDLGDGPSGLELMTYIRRVHPAVAVVLMTDRSALAEGMRLPGGVAFLLKSQVSDPEEIVAVIDSAVRGLDPVRHVHTDNPLAALSMSQREVLRLIALGYSNARIAQERGITLSGAEQAIGRVLRALGVDKVEEISPRVEAARRYILAAGVPRDGR